MATLKKEIRLSGLSTVPSDYDCGDGNLSFALGMVHEDECLRPAYPTAPKTMKVMEDGCVVLFQHKGTSFKHLIYKDSEGYKWTDLNEPGNEMAAKGAFSELPDGDLKISSLGNVLQFVSSGNIYKYIWKSDEDNGLAYKYLGDHMPELEISFSLTAHGYHYSDIDSYDNPVINYEKEGFEVLLEEKYTDSAVTKDGYFKLSDKDKTTVSDAAIGLANKFTGEWCAEKGYFSQPFLIRYGYRLYDGTLVMHSAPVLMLPSTGANPAVFIRTIQFGGHETWIRMVLDCIGIGCELKAEFKHGNLNDWKDIIKSVDFFVSSPIYTYDAGKNIDKFYRPVVSEGNVIVPHTLDGMLPKLMADKYTISDIRGNGNEIVAMWDVKANVISDYEHSANYSNITFDGTYFKDGDNKTIGRQSSGEYQKFDGHCPLATISLPEKTADQINDEIRNCSTFYLIDSVDIEKLGEERVFDLKGGKLSHLETKEAMSDDYESHHSIIPNCSTSYNSRMNYADVNKTYFNGFSSYSAFQKCLSESANHNTVALVVYIKNSTNRYIVLNDDESAKFDDNFNFNYFYYPDPDAYKVGIYRKNTDGEISYVERTMKEHTGLNGAVVFEGIDKIVADQPKFDQAASLPIPSDNPTTRLENLVYTSEVNNPFVFKAANVEQIGSGRIMAMVPAAVAMSQGQFGDYPMYCFTTEGIWALSVSQTGAWSAKQPFSRDVPLDSSMILQMDRDVLFATARGLMVVSGSQVECISRLFDGPEYNLYRTVPNIGALFEDTGVPNAGDETIEDYQIPFKAFINTGGCMLFDYTHQRIIIGNPEHKFSYVFCKKDKLWTTIPVQVLSSVNSYPECYAMIRTADGDKLVDFASSEAGEMHEKGMLVTRPIKLDQPDMMKEFRTLMVRGDFERHNVGVVVYGSRDLENWFVVAVNNSNRAASRHGTGFKYFRVAILTDLEAHESISSMTIEYEIKQKDKIR